MKDEKGVRYTRNVGGLSSHGYGEDYIPMFEGRPIRETVISKDEITNLVIALNTNHLGTVENISYFLDRT